MVFLWRPRDAADGFNRENKEIVRRACQGNVSNVRPTSAYSFVLRASRPSDYVRVTIASNYREA